MTIGTRTVYYSARRWNMRTGFWIVSSISIYLKNEIENMTENEESLYWEGGEVLYAGTTDFSTVRPFGTRTGYGFKGVSLEQTKPRKSETL